YFVSRFGSSILLTPGGEGFDLVAWIAPAVLCLAGLVLLTGALWRWSRRAPAGEHAGDPASPGGVEVTASDRALLQRELERAVAVLRALATREGTRPAVGSVRELRSVSGNGNGRPRRSALRAAPVLVVVAAVAAIGVPLLSSALRDRGPGEAITGTDVAAQGS